MYHDWKDVLARAGKTFVQGSFGVLVTLGAAGWLGILQRPESGKLIGLTAIAAGLAALTSFVWNTVKPPQ